MNQSPNDHVREVLRTTFANRFTCKRYEEGCSVADDDFALLLDIARRSPSSFGLEPWKFLAIETPELLDEVLDHAWGAKRNAARTVIILARKKVGAYSAYVEDVALNLKKMSPEDVPGFQEMLDNFQKNNRNLTDAKALDEWAAKQTYIPLANMLTAAAMMGIDSTPIEGFGIDEMNELLASRGLIDPEEFSASLMIQFGTKAQSHFEPHQVRHAAEDVIQFA